MKHMTFRAWQEDRYLSLWEILRTLGELVADVRWRVHVDEIAPGPGASRVSAIRPDAWLDTSRLLDAVRDDVQVIDGVVFGYRDGESPSFIIRAVDSTWWDVESDDDRVTEMIVDRFPHVEQLPT